MTPPGDHSQDIKFVTATECARQARVDRKTVYRWIKEGKLTAIRVRGKSVRIYKTSWEEFLRSGEVVPKKP
jgi:excisionase family DNA binding protein